MMEEKELFEDYEIGAWKVSPRIYQILGASVLVHLFVILTLSQFNLLQTKACDSPYVGKVCQVLDAAYLGSEFLANDPNFENKDYKPTEIGDEEEIRYIDVSRIEPPLQYPEGYFALANGTDQLSQNPADSGNNFDGTFTNGVQNSSPSTLDLQEPQILPTPNNNVTNQPLPDSPFSFGDDTTPAPVPKTSRPKVYTPSRNRVVVKNTPKLKNDSPASLPKLDETTATSNSDSNSNSNSNSQVAKTDANKNNANTATTPNSEEDPTKFNQKPLKDFGAKYGEQILSKAININAPFVVTIIGKIDENGKITNAKMATADGSDPKMSEVAKDAIAAFSDTKLLRPLYDVITKDDTRKNKNVDVKITFSQNKDNLQVIIQTQAPTEDKAKQISKGLNFILAGIKLARPDSDEAVLMEKTELTTQGKVFTINFLIPNDEKNQMIEKSLNNLKKELEQAKPQSNGIAENKDKDAKAK